MDWYMYIYLKENVNMYVCVFEGSTFLHPCILRQIHYVVFAGLKLAT